MWHQAVDCCWEPQDGWLLLLLLLVLLRCIWHLGADALLKVVQDKVLTGLGPVAAGADHGDGPQ